MEKPIRGKWEELRDEGLPDGRRLLPRKHREGRTMGIWSGVSHPIIIRPCHLETERWSYSQKKPKKQAETDNLVQAAPRQINSDQHDKWEMSWRINKLRNMFWTWGINVLKTFARGSVAPFPLGSHCHTECYTLAPPSVSPSAILSFPLISK